MLRNRKLGRLLIIIAVIIVCGYAAFEARGLIEGPVITITDPKNGSTITDPMIIVKGTAKHISSITMNDRPIFISEEGAIAEPLALLPGLNVITLKGKDRFGKTTTVTLTLVYRPVPVSPPVVGPGTASSTLP